MVEVALPAATSVVPPPPSLLNPSSPWRDLFTKSATQTTLPLPSFNSDGIPIVKAPPEILLKSSEVWKDHFVCFFYGDLPPLKKIFSDLNPIWGKQGKISVRPFTQNSCLILVPSVPVRQWVKEMAMWSAGTVAFSVSEWSPTTSLRNQTLTSAPLWLSLQGVPPQLWSWEAFHIIARGVGIPIPSNRSSPPPIALGPPKVRALVRLDKPLPPSVIVEDNNGDQVTIGISYLNVPSLCSVCSSYGHKSHRCPRRAPEKPQPVSVQAKIPTETATNIASVPKSASVPSNNVEEETVQVGAQVQNPSSSQQTFFPKSPVIVSAHQPNQLNNSPPAHQSHSAQAHQEIPSNPSEQAHGHSSPAPPGSLPNSSYRRRRASLSPRLVEPLSPFDPQHDISSSPRYRSLSPPRSPFLPDPLFPPAATDSLPSSLPSRAQTTSLLANSHIRFTSPVSSQSCKVIDSLTETSTITTSHPIESHAHTPIVIREKVLELTIKQFEEEEELIAAAQKLKRLSMSKFSYPSSSQRKAEKKKRRMLRAQAYANSTSTND